MRKILFAILAIVLLVFTGFIIYKGTNIGKLEIWGIKQISEENELIDEKNSELAKLVDDSYPNALKQLNNAGEKMQEEKKKYEEEVSLASNSKYYMQSEKYKLEFLWTKIGNYAKDNNVKPKMEVSNGSTRGIYNLTITAVGKYKNVASFIYAIENDSRLGFKIEDFSMVQETIDTEEKNANLVRGKFTCKEIRIDLKSLDEKGESKDTSKESNKNNNNNNNTNSTTSSNSNTNTNTTTSDNTTSNTNETENSKNTNENVNNTNTDTSSENTENTSNITT